MMMFPVVGHGAKAYAKAVGELRRLVKAEKPDLVHAHYSTCGIVASLACFGMKRPRVVVSLLGSFPRRNFKWRYVRFFVKHVWASTLSKSKRTSEQLGIEMPIIPSGVNLEQFSLIPFGEARRMCGFEPGSKYVIWCSNPEREEKRWPLAEAAVSCLKDPNVRLVAVFDRPHDEVVKYMCAADCLLLTSVSEGSPNVIKEAMSCNCPIVSTDVGDVGVNLEGMDGCEVAKDDSPGSLASCLRRVLDFGNRTEGRKHILELGLDTGTVAKKIIGFYEESLHGRH